MRRPALTVVALVATVLGLAAAPAYSADPAPAISGVDASTPGHVRATVTTPAPYVAVAVVSGWQLAPWEVVPVGADGAAVDLTTWGADNALLQAMPCTGPAVESCDTGTVGQSDWFTATDSAPDVRWDPRTTVGQSEPYTLEISDPADPEGESLLVAIGPMIDGQVALPHSGSATVPFDWEESGSVSVRRCAAAGYPCRDLGLSSPPVDVRVVGHIGSVLHPGSAVRPDATTAPDLTVDMIAEQDGPQTLSWWIDGTGLGARDVPVDYAGPGSVQVPIDLTGLPDGRYVVSTTLTFDHPEAGTLTGRSDQAFMIDTVAPDFELSTSFDEFFPQPDGFRDRLLVKLRAENPRREDVTGTVELVDRSGRVVRTMTRSADRGVNFDWDGRDDKGDFVPAGRYRIRARLTDAAGNVASRTATVAVSDERLRHLTLHQKLAPSRFLVDSKVGACSRISRPSARGIAGSLGLYSNVRCDRGDAKSMVSTVYAARLPAAVKYSTVRVDTVGGAARSMPGSLAAFRMFSSKGRWDGPTMMDDRWGLQLGTETRAKKSVRKGHLAWAVVTGGGARYDLGSFVLTLKYVALVPVEKRPQAASRATAASTRSSVAVNATRTWRPPALP